MASHCTNSISLAEFVDRKSVWMAKLWLSQAPTPGSATRQLSSWPNEVEKQLQLSFFSISISAKKYSNLKTKDATVVLACRDQKRGQLAVANIVMETNNRRVYLELLDLASFESIRAFVDRFKKNYTRLDILVNNAGLSMEKLTLTKDQIETTFGVNHLGPFLLTNLLLDTIKSTSNSRIVNVSSVVHYCNQSSSLFSI